MSLLLRLISFITAAVMALSLCGCMSVDDGRYNQGEDGAAQTFPPNDERLEPTISTTPAAEMTEPTETDPPSLMTEPDVSGDIPSDSTYTLPKSEEKPSESVSEISDVIEPLATTAQRDYSALDTESHGYGQGVRFDDLNRPKGAVEFNNGYSKYNATAINDSEEKVINLTFDQGYENGFTSIILDTLKEKGVIATFFVVGDYAERQPELVQRMIDEGHTVGSHSVNHYSMPELSVEKTADEIMGLHEYMIEHFGVAMSLFRPPKGEYSEQSLAITADLGYKTVLWSFAYADWDTKNQPDRETSLQKLIDRAHPGAIYLLHSVSETNAYILGDFIDAMLAEGYTFGCEF